MHSFHLQGKYDTHLLSIFYNIVSPLKRIVFALNRFVGGLQIIIFTLLPFFVVTGAILIAFTITYRIEYKIDKGTDAILAIDKHITEKQLNGTLQIMDYDDVRDSLKFQCIYSFDKCLDKTLQAFFSGGDVDNWLDIVFGIVAIIIVSLFFLQTTRCMYSFRS